MILFPIFEFKLNGTKRASEGFESLNVTEQLGRVGNADEKEKLRCELR
jgi:hypothetical protein